MESRIQYSPARSYQRFKAMDRALVLVNPFYETHYNYSIKKFGAQVARVRDEVLECMYDMRNADTPEELFAASTNANHIMHVTRWPSGFITKDYGSSRGLSYVLIDSISNGPDEYFGQDEIDRFMALSKLPAMPQYVTKEMYRELRKSRSFIREATRN